MKQDNTFPGPEVASGDARTAAQSSQTSSVSESSPVPSTAWFWDVVWSVRRHYAEAMVAALSINVLALATTFFTMHVYDRVVPNEAYATLWSLAIGTVLALLFEFCTRHARAALLDDAGRRCDLQLGRDIFERSLGVRIEHRPASSGAFASLVREFEAVREFATSATMITLTDLPFSLIFIGSVALLGGPLVWITLLFAVLVALAGFAIQHPLGRLADAALHEGSSRHATIGEAVAGLETLRAAGAGGFMLRRWEAASQNASWLAVRSRLLSAAAMNWVLLMQQAQTVALVTAGVYLIHAGQLSLGSLVAVVMLGSRALGPLGQIATLMVRYQSARAALRSLSRVMAAEQERVPGRHYLAPGAVEGALGLERVGFSYPGPQRMPILEQASLHVRAGERIAILGKVGSGKSTLMRLLSGMYIPVSGLATLDGLDLRQIDPDLLRRMVGFAPQETTLFEGSLRDNILLGRDVGDDCLARTMHETGLDAIAARHPLGYDMPVGEQGRLLSGGQRQLTVLARLIVGQPKVWLLDEPTSLLDANTQRGMIASLDRLVGSSTLIFATHRPEMLALAQRIVVVDAGRIVLDGPCKEVIHALSGDAAATSAATPSSMSVSMSAASVGTASPEFS